MCYFVVVFSPFKMTEVDHFLSHFVIVVKSLLMFYNIILFVLGFFFILAGSIADYFFLTLTRITCRRASICTREVLHMRLIAWFVGLELKLLNFHTFQAANATLVAVNHISLLQTFSKINALRCYFLFSFFLFFYSMVHSCSKSHGSREQQVAHTSEKIGFFHCPGRLGRELLVEHAVGARQLLLIDTLW